MHEYEGHVNWTPIIQARFQEFAMTAMDGFEQCGRGGVTINQPESRYVTQAQLNNGTGPAYAQLQRVVSSYNPLTEFVVVADPGSVWLLKLPRSSFY